MYKKILIPLDNSLTDEAILTHIKPLARLCEAEIVLVHVADGFAARLQEQLNLADSEEIVNDRAYLESVAGQFKQNGFNVKHYLLKGDPVDSIVRLLKQEGCDLIAMATHGHEGVMDWVMGSVADGLRHKTCVPILMVRGAKAKDS
ncbi:MAG: universal stress protein [Candidatus Omnitrophica bacterium]|nr:universal stress protein [Candidatus Omnitrophota bacterium]